MNILLTGHGSLGVPLAQRLLAMGHQVRVLSRAPRADVPWQVVVGRLDDHESVRAAVDGCEIVIHNGVHQGDHQDFSKHPEFVATNVGGSANVFQAAIESGVRHVVHLSSDVAVGVGMPAADLEAAGRARCVRDTDPYDGYSIYAATKIAAEQIGRYYRQHHGLSVTMLRPGWFPPPGRLADHEFVYRTLGHCLWVGDMIRAVLAAMDNPAQGEFLIHAAVPFTDADAVGLMREPEAVLRRYFPDEIGWWVEQGLPIAPVRWWADISPARQQLGFEPALNFPQAVARLRAGKSPWPTAGLQIAQ